MNRNVAEIMHVTSLTPDQQSACRDIAYQLPEWFGNEEGLAAMRESLQLHESVIAVRGDQIVGFLTFERHFPEAWEIAWMAVHPDHHRTGIGHSLIDSLCAFAQESQVHLMQVKTLADLRPNAEYARTRAFYAAMGFQRLQVFPELWDPVNPCLLLVKPIPQTLQHITI